LTYLLFVSFLMYLFIYMVLFIRFNFKFFILYINYLILDSILNKTIYQQWKSGTLIIFYLKLIFVYRHSNSASLIFLFILHIKFNFILVLLS